MLNGCLPPHDLEAILKGLRRASWARASASAYLESRFTVRFRALGALVAAAVALTGLSACQSNVGKAAAVGGQRISETDVSGYLTARSKSLSDSSGAAVAPRNLVLSTLIQERLYDRALQVHGGVPGPGDLSTARDAVLNGATEAQLTTQVVDAGLAASFAPVFLHTQILLSVLQARATDNAKTTQILGTIAKIPVAVSPRYGSWDSAQRTLSGDPVESVKSFVTLAAS
jgi:hypothetical protein